VYRHHHRLRTQRRHRDRLSGCHERQKGGGIRRTFAGVVWPLPECGAWEEVSTVAVLTKAQKAAAFAAALLLQSIRVRTISGGASCRPSFYLRASWLLSSWPYASSRALNWLRCQRSFSFVLFFFLPSFFHVFSFLFSFSVFVL